MAFWGRHLSVSLIEWHAEMSRASTLIIAGDVMLAEWIVRLH